MKDDGLQDKSKLGQKESLAFIMILTLTVDCESLSLQSNYDKALHYCSDRSSSCRDLETKILIIPLSNCHNISSL
jgi:hypothetical protein